jgi:hypothetical protein
MKVIRRESDGYLMPYSQHTKLTEGLTVIEVERAAPAEAPKAKVKAKTSPRKKPAPIAPPSVDNSDLGGLDELDD